MKMAYVPTIATSLLAEVRVQFELDAEAGVVNVKTNGYYVLSFQTDPATGRIGFSRAGGIHENTGLLLDADGYIREVS